jgi:hypothetical protein
MAFGLLEVIHFKEKMITFAKKLQITICLH